MKISSDKVFVGDMYIAQNYKKNNYVMFDDTEFGSVNFDECLTEKEHILIKFGNAYVPIEYCRNMVSYMSLLYKSATYPDERFLFEGSLAVNKPLDKFLKNVRPYTTVKQKLSLKKLLDFQNKRNLETFFKTV